MKKNRIYAIILVMELALSFALAGCGNNKTAETTTATVTTTVASTTAATTKSTTKKAESPKRTRRVVRTTRHAVKKTAAANTNDQGCINDDEAESW